MHSALRIATFNVENLDDRPEDRPGLSERLSVMRPQLIRLRADILCLQEVHSQESQGERSLRALDRLLENTPYTEYHRVVSKSDDGQRMLDQRNLVIASRFPIVEEHQYRHQFADAPLYRMGDEHHDRQPQEISWERPILHAVIALSPKILLHVINLHLKSRRPVEIAQQMIDFYTWKSASGWAEGCFLSSIKRLGQALETRRLIDSLFDRQEDALIAVCGDFNAESDDLPVKVIRGDVADTGNGGLTRRVIVPCERSIPEPARFTIFYHGGKYMFDHVLVSRPMLTYYRSMEIHNEILHDETIAFATDQKYPESDHAPVIAKFSLPDLEPTML